MSQKVFGYKKLGFFLGLAQFYFLLQPFKLVRDLRYLERGLEDATAVVAAAYGRAQKNDLIFFTYTQQSSS